MAREKRNATIAWLERSNPLRGLTIAQANSIFDCARNGDTQRLHWMYQEIEAQNFYRPGNQSVYDKYVFEADSNTITEVPADGKWINDNITLTNINHFGGWAKARKVHFADGANFDQIYEQ